MDCFSVTVSQLEDRSKTNSWNAIYMKCLGQRTMPNILLVHVYLKYLDKHLEWVSHTTTQKKVHLICLPAVFKVQSNMLASVFVMDCDFINNTSPTFIKLRMCIVNVLCQFWAKCYIVKVLIVAWNLLLKLLFLLLSCRN